MEIYIIDFIAFIVYVFVSLFFLGFFSTPKKTDARNDIRGNNSRKNSIERLILKFDKQPNKMAINVVNTNKQVIMLDVVSLLYSSINVIWK